MLKWFYVSYFSQSNNRIFFYPDDKDTEKLEEKLAAIENVASAQLIDMRKIA